MNIENWLPTIIIVMTIAWLFQSDAVTEKFGLVMKAPVTASRMSAPYGTVAAIIPVYDHLSAANVTRGETIMKSAVYGQQSMYDLVGQFDEPISIVNSLNRLSQEDKYYVATALLARFKRTSEVYKTQKNHDTFMYLIAPQLYVSSRLIGLVNPTNRNVLQVWDIVSASLKLQYT